MPECVCKLREFGIRGRRFHRSIIPHGASEAISMSEYDEVWRVLVSIMEIMKQQSEFAGRTHARLVVLRKAIASLNQNPSAAEEYLQKREADAEDTVLSDQGFPESDAVVQLIKAGKKLDEFDA
jgi:hypothetical protein